MEVVYEFKNPDWTLVWSQPGEMIPYFDRAAEAQGIREGYGAVYHGDKDKLIVWVGDSQVFTETKAVEWTPAPPRRFTRVRTSTTTKTGSSHQEQHETRFNIEAGVATAFLCVLGNLSLILGRKLNWDPVKQESSG
jgi:hypothetical protein